ncbi:MAG: hypothetical protein F6K24_14205 [Okeania sp. SIO2D1]|nr:hypothetical protein [Okeania sp. SIO2D1]
MEPITIVMALAAVLGTKALEKTGENIGQVVWDKSAKLMKYLKQESPDTVTAIEQISEQPLDYGQAVLEMQEAAENPDVARTIQELAAAVEENSHPKLTEVVEEIREALKSLESEDEKNANIVAKEVKAEKGGMVVGKSEKKIKTGKDGIVADTIGKIDKRKIDRRTTI